MAKRGTLRASDADRDQFIDRLRKASAEGRLSAHELEQRVTTALRARTYAELDATVADLPGKRVGERRSAPHVAVRAVQAHPALLIVAIPVALVAVAAMVAITVLWSTVMFLALVLGNRRHPYRGPWMYAARHRSGRLRGAQGGRGPWA